MAVRNRWLRSEQGQSGSSVAIVRAVLEDHESRNLRRLTVTRSLVFIAIFFWLWANYGWWVATDNALILAAFIANGLLAYALTMGRDDRRWVAYAVVSVDAALLAFTLMAPGRTYPDDWPWPTVLRQPSFLYFLLLPALAALSFRPSLVLWSVFSIAMVWAAGTAMVVHSPGARVSLPDLDGVSASTAQMTAYLDPYYVHIDDAIVRIFITVLLGIILAYGAYRARELMVEQAEVVRERANLARYVAPNMVEALARTDRPMGEIRTHDVAILFADIKGFTALAEAASPADAMLLLRDFHARMATCVFAHGGTLDKFIGDGLMATFGTPKLLPDAADRALACALSMLRAVEDWQAVRRTSGERAIEVGIGIHYGPATMGDIGGGGEGGAGQRFEFAVIGDTINVASRLEHLTRELDVSLLVSDTLVTHLKIQPKMLRLLGSHPIDGRSATILLWTVR
jgi:adenylate cyclase